ncbi:hypothetical protein N3K66_003978 [Trichothecium roseum]|uniref:Uncharacterized protein n=1 Tax=Trichothecium roseum TaxID=47278 RepID=A0ACC0V6Z2_9HYPO|nr:hypothetical protein N3K66_003978 [Trichothecium roseum]
MHVQQLSDSRYPSLSALVIRYAYLSHLCLIVCLIPSPSLGADQLPRWTYTNKKKEKGKRLRVNSKALAFFRVA